MCVSHQGQTMRKKAIEEPAKIEPIRQARFYGTPGLEPIGYVCNGLAIKRDRNETVEELRTRCRDSVAWPDTYTQHVFIPIQKQ
jgi:hypothetical protein